MVLLQDGQENKLWIKDVTRGVKYLHQLWLCRSSRPVFLHLVCQILSFQSWLALLVQHTHTHIYFPT